MNTTQLECFLRVANTLNFVRAAQELNISQPALSKQIKSLENELSAQLFERTTRSVKLTATGKRFYSDAQKILSQINDSKRRVIRSNAEQLRTIRIGYSDAHELQRLTPAVVKLRKEYRDVIPEYEIGLRDVNLQALREGMLDVVLALKDDIKLGKNMSFHPLMSEKLYCVVTANHPLAGRETVLSEEVRQYPEILCVPYSPIIAARTNRFINSVPLNDDDNLTICTSSAEAYSFALSEIGAAILPRHLIVPFPMLRLIPVTDSQVHTYGIYCNKLTANNIVKRFAAVAKEVFSKIGDLEDIWPAEFREMI